MYCQECGEPLPENAPKRTRFCPECSKKHRAVTQRKYRLAHLEQVRIESNKSYHYYRDRGICINCRTERALPGRPMCKECNDKRVEYQRKYWQRVQKKKKA